ncbi:MAG TPA: hypothetical protein VMD59_05175 [Acidimicrobiales bacterium]|nr:hypothetical protein [Acidimicrobiales bacterium]
MTASPVASQPDRQRRPDRQRVGLLAHQVVEYVIGAALIVSGVHVNGSVQLLLIGLGVLLILLSAFTKGPLGAVRVLSRRLHHALDLLVVVGLVLSPLVSLRHPSVAAIVIAEVVAVVLLRIERGTDYAGAPGRVAGSPALANVSPVGGVQMASSQVTSLLPGSSPISLRPGSADREWDPAAVTPSEEQLDPAGSTAAAPPGGRAEAAGVELAAVARSGAAVASAAAAYLAPVAAKAARRSAFQLGVLTAATRKVARQRAAATAGRRAPDAARPGSAGGADRSSGPQGPGAERV